MWLIEFCERAGKLDADGKMVLFIVGLVALTCLGVVFQLISQWIETRKPKDKEDE